MQKEPENRSSLQTKTVTRGDTCSRFSVSTRISQFGSAALFQFYFSYRNKTGGKALVVWTVMKTVECSARMDFQTHRPTAYEHSCRLPAPTPCCQAELYILLLQLERIQINDKKLLKMNEAVYTAMSGLNMSSITSRSNLSE